MTNENLQLDLNYNPTPASPAVAGMEAHSVPAIPSAPHAPKASHRQLAILLTVFAILAGTLVGVAVAKPELVTMGVPGWFGSQMHSAAPSGNVYANKHWVNSENPDSMLEKQVPVPAAVEPVEKTAVTQPTAATPETKVEVPAAQPTTTSPEARAVNTPATSSQPVFAPLAPDEKSAANWVISPNKAK
jgi:hypothetical protein